MLIDLGAGQVANIALKCCGKVIGLVKLKFYEVQSKAARDLLASKVGSSKSVVVGAFDARTGKVTAEYSAKYVDDPSSVLKALADELGGVGTKTSCGNTLGCCAEFQAADTLIKEGSLLADIRFVPAIRPRRPENVVPFCRNCVEMFDKNINAGSIPLEMPKIIFIPLGDDVLTGED
jgi:hypothetical protein